MAQVENATEQLLSRGSWTVDPAHSTVAFRVKHMMIQTVTGRFRDFDGVLLAGDEPSLFGTIKVASVDTLYEDRDAHLRSADFFDVERYPEISFHAVGLQFVDGDGTRVALSGDLTIKGVNRPIVLDGELRGTITGDDGTEHVALALCGQLDRSDYGLVWNRLLDTGGVLVGDAVELLLDIAIVRVDE